MALSSSRCSLASMPSSFGRDHLVDVVHRLENALAGIAALVAVAQLQRLVLAGGGSAGNGGASARSAFQDDIGFNGGISAGIQNFTGKNQLNLSHGMSPALSPVDSLARGESEYETCNYTGAATTYGDPQPTPEKAPRSCPKVIVFLSAVQKRLRLACRLGMLFRSGSRAHQGGASADASGRPATA